MIILQTMNTIFKAGNSEDLNSSQAVLLMEVGERHCCFGIIDYANQMLVQLGYYTCAPNDDHLLETVIERHAELRQSFRKTVIGYYLPESILVPSRFYRYDEAPELLRALYQKGSNVAVSEAVPEWQLYNSYHVPTPIHQFLSAQYSTGNFWHVYSITLKNAVGDNESGTLIVDFKTDSFMAMAIKNNSLLMAQIFPYTKSDDVLYWLLKICKQFSLSQSAVKVILSGLVDKQSAVFKDLYQYFLNLDFAPIENDIQLSRAFEEYPVHFFSSLYKLALCAS